MTNPLTAHRRALELVEKATGPDREIECEIGRILGWRTFTTDRPGPQGIIWKAPWAPYPERWGSPAPWTASLDAVIALVEREMPPEKALWSVGSDTYPPNDSIKFYEASIWIEGKVAFSSEGHPFETPALALLAAFLRACIAEMEQETETESQEWDDGRVEPWD